MIKRPTEELMKGADLLSQGDFTYHLTPRSWDEMGMLSATFRSLEKGFSRLITRLKRLSERMWEVSRSLFQATDEQSNAAAEFATSLEEIHASSEELVRTAEEITRSAQTVSELAEESLSHAEHGVELMQRNTEKAEAISEVADQGTQKMRTLGGKMQEISKILELIENIAAETKILSINAAIESARSGEQGRGFSVVAAEIRKLADHTIQSTSKVKSFVADILDLTQQAVSAIEMNQRGISEQKDLITELRESVGQIVGFVKKTAESAGRISSAIDQQLRATEHVENALREISTVVKQFTNATIESREQADTLKNMADELNGIISLFRIDEAYSKEETPETMESFAEMSYSPVEQEHAV